MRIVLKFLLGTLLRSNTSRRERETEWQLRETRRKKYPSSFFLHAPPVLISSFVPGMSRILINLRADIKNFYEPLRSPPSFLPLHFASTLGGRVTDILYSRKTNYN